MKIESPQQIILLVRDDGWMMDVLRTAKTLRLPDWWVCAGFVRAKIWDTLHGYDPRTPLPDVDVVYFDPHDISEETEKKWEGELRRLSPEIPWSVKNEARMHAVNGIPPYTSAVDAISKFPETATALGLALDERDEILLAAPWGIEDAVRCIVRPTPCFENNPEQAYIYEERLAKKNWKSIWPKVQVIPIR
ncbi:nucleotidyltransferase family protein [Cohnella candidum]|uniref:Nucleotidyltransferase family protein n=1 Tax=Cohnella candidum TaxID=2674991 RepID=A0A3G3JXD6_9BACL|nr:nucleotidyltransferase family protein [Cohnella candidum]AYQ72874.1 nucleotidyltransferase family protein [Cohnella candidum]